MIFGLLSEMRGTIARGTGRPGEQGRRPGLPWIGVFLLVFGGLLVIQQLYPQSQALGSMLMLAIGLAFLIRWAVTRGVPVGLSTFFHAGAGPFTSSGRYPSPVRRRMSMNVTKMKSSSTKASPILSAISWARSLSG